MSDTFWENPYVSPEGAAEPAKVTVEAIRGVWRDRDELVLRRRDVEVPKACWVTNCENHVWRSGVPVESLSSVLPIALCYVPIIGIGLFYLWLVGFLLTRMFIERRSFSLNHAHKWLSSRYRFWEGFISLGTMLLVFGIIVLSNVSFLTGSFAMGSLAVLLAVVTFLGLWYTTNGNSVGLHYSSAERGIIRVRGVHPGYLERLPPYSRSDLEAENGAAQPFVH